MDAYLSSLTGVLHHLYHGNLIDVLEDARIALHSVWTLALILLVTKLLWSPLDKATTYGKLLYSRKSDKEEERVSSKDGKDENQNLKESPKSAQQGVSKVSWMNMRFAFTSSYFIGLFISSALLVVLILTVFSFQDSCLSPATPPCNTLPISYNPAVHVRINQIDPTRTGESNSQGEQKDFREIEERKNEKVDISGHNSVDSSQTPEHHDSKEPDFLNRLRWYQSICSLTHKWQNKSLSNLSFDELSTDLALYVLTNASLFKAIVFSLLLIFHLTRRISECVFVHFFSPRSISAHNLLLMWAYYVVVPFVLMLDIITPSIRDIAKPSISFGYNLESILATGLGVELFIIGSVMQFSAHRTLSLGRSQAKVLQKAKKYEYFVPKGFLFDLVSGPHYLAEFVIYASFALICEGSRGSVLVLIFVGITMASQALKTHSWYKANFPQKLLGSRTAIIPYVL